jgi:hypothetical protein
MPFQPPSFSSLLEGKKNVEPCRGLDRRVEDESAEDEEEQVRLALSSCSFFLDQQRSGE